MITIPELWKDPDFVNLHPIDKKAVMAKVDPDFAALSPRDQDIAALKMSAARGGMPKNTAPSMTEEPAPATAPDPRNSRQAFIDNEGTYGTRLKEGLNDMLRSGAKEVLTGPTAPATSIGDFATRVLPESVGKLIPRAVGSLVEMGKNIGTPYYEAGREILAGDPVLPALANAARDTTLAQGKAVRDVADFATSRIGLQGLDKAKEGILTDPAGTAAVVAPLIKPGLRAASSLSEIPGKVIPSAEKLYASSLKQSTAIPMEQRAANVKAGLEGGYVPNKKGLSRLLNDIGSLNDQIGAAIEDSAKGGTTVPVESIISRLDDVKQRAIDSFGDNKTVLDKIDAFADSLREHPSVINKPEAKQSYKEFTAEKMGQYMKEEGGHGPAMQRISKEWAEYKNKPPEPSEAMIPIDVAQKMKTNTYRELKNTYGELKGFEVEAKKAMARGAKEEIVSAIPELADLNAKDSSLINLEKVLFKAVNRIENRDLMGIGVPIKIAAGAMGGPKGAIIGAITGLIDTPSVKANLAIAMFKARKRAGNYTPMPKIRKEIDLLSKRLKDERGMVGADINSGTNKGDGGVKLYRGDSINADGIGKGTVGDMGEGIYFTDSPHSAEYFTDGSNKDHLRNFDVSISRPFELDSRVLRNDPVMQKIVKEMPDGLDKKNLQRWLTGDLDVKNTYNFLARSTGNTPETFNRFLSSKGYDSVVDQGVRGVSEGDKQYVIFAKDRIKRQESP